MPLSQALETARKRSLDLVEVAATAVPPVCRLLDYGKYKFEQTKKDREARRSQKTSLLREVRIRPKIGIHDFEAKVKIAKKLLVGGDKVKVTVMFRGREITHPDIGWKLLQKMSESLKEVWKLLQKMSESLKEVASVERQPLLEGKRMHIILSTAQKPKTEGGKTTVNAKN